MPQAPFPYFGGKRRIAATVWGHFGHVDNYVEPFAGSLAVLLNRPTTPRIETVNDLDCYLANFWRAVTADPQAVAAHADWPVNEADLHARHRWLVDTGAERVSRLRTDPDYYDVKVAGWWVWGICMWIGSGWCSRPEWTGQANAGRRSRGIHAEGWKSRPELTGAGQGVHNLDQKRPAMGGRNAGRGVHATSLSSQVPFMAHAGRGEHRALLTQQLPSLAGDSGAAGSGVHSLRVQTDIYGYFAALQERLRRVRVRCGDWRRVVTPSVTFKNGLTGVFLDPPYDQDLRDSQIYSHETAGISAAVREWALANGDNEQLRIAFCGYDNEHEMPDDWVAVRWKAHGGYGNNGTGRARENAHREVVWFSPHCLDPREGMQLQQELVLA